MYVYDRMFEGETFDMMSFFSVFLVKNLNLSELLQNCVTF